MNMSLHMFVCCTHMMYEYPFAYVYVYAYVYVACMHMCVKVGISARVS
jgi:hypothetical protein